MSLPLSPIVTQSSRKVTPLFISKVDIIEDVERRHEQQAETRHSRIISAFLLMVVATASLAGIDRTVLLASLVSFGGFALLLFGTTILVCDLSAILSTFLQRRNVMGNHHIFVA
jgi:hypothetical protein